MRLIVIFLISLLLPINSIAKENVVNVYAWANEIPDVVVRQFEKETGITVNISTFENNESMFAKLRALKNPGYDVIMPSSYFVDRMRALNMLAPLDLSKIPNMKNIETHFRNPIYDPGNQYSAPHVWGLTGIFYNKQFPPAKALKKWADLWDKSFHNQLMMLDDTRELFSMALLMLGYSANDNNPEHIRAAFLKLKELMSNIKVFSTETVISILIDEDAKVGMVWNGDITKAASENKNLEFVFPEEGFVIWVDTFAIPQDAPHRDNAHRFINFMLRADIAEQVALIARYPITNHAGKERLPAAIRNNPVTYPPPEVMRRGQFQTNLSSEILSLYEQYWEELKTS